MKPYSHNGIVLSVHPMWLGQMAEGRKTLEVRKKLPRLQPPFKVYLYCTKLSEKQLYRSPAGVYVSEIPRRQKDFCCAGRVVGEFTCTKVYAYSTREKTEDTISTKELIRRSRLTFQELYDYECMIGHRSDPDERSGLLAMEITDLVFFDRPRLLSDYGIVTSPQSWVYARRLPK